MVNTADRTLIADWMEQPRPLSEAEQTTVAAMLTEWPWFCPARHLKAGNEQTATPQVASMLGEMQLYAGNWLVLHGMMESASKTPVSQMQPAPEAATVPAEHPTSTEALAFSLSAALDHEVESPGQLIQPVFTEDYFRHQGIEVDDALPKEVAPPEDPKSLMVVMSFAEWLQFFRQKNQKEKEEEDDKRAWKSHWQKEKLAAAMEEEDDEIPENVFEMAVNSISREDGLVSESLAEILVKQGKRDAAIDMYRKLSLRNPAKSAYFAAHIEQLQTQHDS